MPTEYYPLIEMALVLIVVVGWGVRELILLRRYRKLATRPNPDDPTTGTASSDPPVRPGRRQP